MKLFTIGAAAAGLTIAGSLQAAVVIDQNAPVAQFNIANFYQDDLAQSFVQSASTISGAGIFLTPSIGTSDTVTISLWDALPNVAGANLLASGSAIGTQGNWVDVAWSPVALTAATTYYLVFAGNTSLGIAGDANNGYAFGTTFANTGYQAYATLDYAFRTYAGTVPEPASWALMMTGLGLTGGALRVRRKDSMAA